MFDGSFVGSELTKIREMTEEQGIYAFRTGSKFRLFMHINHSLVHLRVLF